MNRYTITVKHGTATIQELFDAAAPVADQIGIAIHEGSGLNANAEALGHAMFYLSTVESLENGVKLDIIQDE